MYKIALGADHAGFLVKEELISYIRTLGHQATDLGTFSEERADYPDYAHAVSKAVEDQVVDMGILVCGSGNGVCISANRHLKVRAVLAWLPEIASLGKQHNNANVLCIPARYVDQNQAEQITLAFLTAEFEGGRHQQRVEKI
jgi:ribose 5-phosphate isomerase B